MSTTSMIRKGWQIEEEEGESVMDPVMDHDRSGFWLLHACGKNKFSHVLAGPIRGCVTSETSET